MKAVVLAAGKGTRLYPLTINTPKILMPLFGKPLIMWFLDMLKEHANEIVFIIGDNDYSKQIETYITSQSEDFKKLYPKISFVYQTEQLGTAHALQSAKVAFPEKERFIFMYGDDLYAKEDLENMLKHDYSIIGMKVNDPEKWGILQSDENGNLKQVVEKPEQFVGDIANVGMYVVDSDIFEIFDQIKISSRGEYEVTDSVSMFAQNHTVKVVALEKYWLPLGYPWMFLDAQEKLIANHGFTGDNVIIGKNCTIEEGAVIENSIIGDGCTIKKGAEIKSSLIGKNCVIEENVELEDTNADGGTIKTIIKGKLVDTQREQFGATIGDGVVIGANAKIHAGVKIWPGLKVEAGAEIDKDLEA